MLEHSGNILRACTLHSAHKHHQSENIILVIKGLRKAEEEYRA